MDSPHVPMDTPDTPRDSRLVTLSLPPADQWTLHHVLLDRIEAEATASEPTETDPPPVEVFRAFERLDAGETRFTVAELTAIRDLLAEYHHSSKQWEPERACLERLLYRVTDRIDDHRTALSAD